MNRTKIIQILIDNPKSWMWDYIDDLEKIIKKFGINPIIRTKHSDVIQGDILILLSCELIFKKLHLNKHNLVVHESNLPQGKGFSPLTWQILEGKNKIPITLFEASEKIDSGKIYFKDTIILEGNELIQEIRKKQAIMTFNLIEKFLNKKPSGTIQKGIESFYHRRHMEDSKLDINKTIIENFNLLRVVDNEKYPAFFKINDVKYIVKIYKGG